MEFINFGSSLCSRVVICHGLAEVRGVSKGKLALAK